MVCERSDGLWRFACGDVLILAQPWDRQELLVIHWCQNNQKLFRAFSFLHGSHDLNAWRAWRTKSRGLKGLRLEVRAQRAPRLLVVHITWQAIHLNFITWPMAIYLGGQIHYSGGDEYPRTLGGLYCISQTLPWLLLLHYHPHHQQQQQQQQNI